MACLRGFEPPTFGSGVRNAGGIYGASERDRTSDLLITNQLAERFKLLIIKVISWDTKSIVLGLCSPAAPLILPFYQTS
jgi:hypothetical protein